MKNISKFLLILATGAFALASCDTFKDEMEPTKPIAAPPVEITVSELEDNSFSFTLAPNGDASYYSYLVTEADKPEAKDSSVLYALGYDGLAKGIVKYADEKTKTVNLSKLKSNCTYQIYAVAGSIGDNVGTVAVKSVKTTDTTAPVLEVETEIGAVTSYTAKVTGKKAVISFVFDDQISLSETPKVVATVYGENYFSSSQAGNVLKAIDEFDIPKANLSTAGNVLIVSIPEDHYIPGAYIGVAVMKGAVVNATGIASSEDYDKNLLFTDPDDNLGAFLRYDNVEFPLVPSLEAGATLIYTDYSTVAVNLAPTLSSPDLNTAFRSDESIRVISKDAKGRSVSYNLQSEEYSEGKLTVGLDEDPGYGTTQSYDFPKGCLIDIYGNESAALKLEDRLLCSYGYSLDDITGTYEIKGDSYFDGPGAINTVFVIAPSDNAQKGNIMFTTFGGFTCNQGNIYGTFNMDNGDVQIGDWQYFAQFATYDLYFAVSGADFVTLSVPAAGTLAGPDTIFGIYLLKSSDGSELGWYEIFTKIQGTRTSASYVKTAVPVVNTGFATKDFIIHQGVSLDR